MEPRKLLNTQSWLPLVVFATLPIVYLLFAPNYEWKTEETGTAYGADFLQEWVGARMFITGHVSELYDLETFKAWQYNPKVVGFAWNTNQYFPPVYPPPHYILFSPFACLPYRWAVVVWLFALVLAAFFSAKLMAEIAIHASSGLPGDTNVSSESTRAKSRYLWLGLLLFPMFLFSITLGQKSVVWLLIICATWRLLQCHRDYVAGMVFGILSIKPTLFFLIPLVLLRNGNWRFFIGASTSVVILWGGAGCLVPIETWMAFSKVLSTAGNYAENGGYRLEWSCNLMTFAYSLPRQLVDWCKGAVCLTLTIYLLYCVFEDRQYSLTSPEKAMMLLATTLLISPHTYQYDLCVLMLPVLWMCATASKSGVATFALLAMGVTVAGEVQSILNIPVVPIVLVGIVCELRLRAVLGGKPKSTQKVFVGIM